MRAVTQRNGQYKYLRVILSQMAPVQAITNNLLITLRMHASHHLSSLQYFTDSSEHV